MPSIQALPTQDLYFKSLDALDVYQSKKQLERSKADQTTPWIPRKTGVQGSRGKLLVCHDYKGGYNENPLSLSYTFNYWSLCDTFIYFSHHRVTIPPPGWVNAAHRQGVKILGTLIFEHDGEPDCLRLLVGKLPSSATGPVLRSQRPHTLPISSHYARVFAELAHERGFDGYLLNFECPLQGGLEQTRSLAAWISLLNSELIKRVGPHAQTVWYDSVIFTGKLAWQDRLNSFNLPFFIPSTDFFSNYTWPRDHPNTTAQYFLNLEPNLVGIASDFKPKTLENIYIGVDVWGRGSHGGGGFGCYKAIDHIAPDSLGLSVALFGQAWTWETEEGKSEWSWHKWWQYERDLWVGSPDIGILTARVPKDTKDPDCPHGSFRPFSDYFARLPPPDPSDLPFHTSFCPGVGYSWFLAGARVFQNHHGWTDIDKQTAMGDLLWPRPELKWEADSEGIAPLVSSSVYMEDAWNGGSSVKLDFEEPEHQDLVYRTFSLPIQTLCITTQKQYTASAVYKVLKGHDDLDIDCALSIWPTHIPGTTSTSTDNGPSQQRNVEVAPDSLTSTEVSNGWVKISLQFTISDAPLSTVSVKCAIGLVVTAVSEDPTLPFNPSILLGQINVYPTPQPIVEPNIPHILWVDSEMIGGTSQQDPSSQHDDNNDNSKITHITWQLATSLQRVDHISITSPDDVQCVWTPQPPGLSDQWFPGFLYFNIYAASQSVDSKATTAVQQLGHNSSHQQSEVPGYTDMTWIGTSGADGSIGRGRFEFAFEKGKLPGDLKTLAKVRIFVQGILDTGETLGWDKCAYVDI